MFRQKAKNIVGLAKGLVEKHGGEVPRTLAELVELPGRGRKTANVVLGVLGAPEGVVVDTHVQRVSQRLGWTQEHRAREDRAATCANSSRATSGTLTATCSSFTAGASATRASRAATAARERRVPERVPRRERGAQAAARARSAGRGGEAGEREEDERAAREETRAEEERGEEREAGEVTAYARLKA